MIAEVLESAVDAGGRPIFLVGNSNGRRGIVNADSDLSPRELVLIGDLHDGKYDTKDMPQIPNPPYAR